jgi:hypothetical protein
VYNYVFYSLASLGSMVELHRSLSMGSGASLTPPPRVIRYRAGIFKQSMGARNRVGMGLSYRPARLAEFIPWNQFLGSINV